MCKAKQLKPKYINVKISGQKSQDKKTTINAIRFRINQEIKFLYRKKRHPNQQLYHLNLENAHQYNGMWQHIQEYIIIIYRYAATTPRLQIRIEL